MADFEEEIDLVVIYEAEERMDQSINKRFEKDADLYISKQETDEIKACLAGNSFQALYGMYKSGKHSADILARTMLKNAWLIGNIEWREFESYILPILDEGRPNVVCDMLKEVVHNRIDTPYKLKGYLDAFYYNKFLPVDECRNILEYSQVHIKADLLAIFFKKVLLDTQRADVFFRTAEQFFEKYGNERDVKFLAKLLPEMVKYDDMFMQELSELVFTRKIIGGKGELVWENFFKRLGRRAFNQCLDNLLPSQPRTEKKKVSEICKCIAKIIKADKAEADYYQQQIVAVYQKREDLRYPLIVYMCDKIHDACAVEIAREFSNIGIPWDRAGLCEEKLRALVTGQHNRQIDNVEVLYQELAQCNNEGHLRKIIMQINADAHDRIYAEMLEKPQQNRYMREFAFNYPMFNPSGYPILLNYLQQNHDEELRQEFYEFITNNSLVEKRPEIKEFLYLDNFELYTKIYKR